MNDTENLLRSGILPFWLERMRDPRGGWLGRIDGRGNIDADAPKGCVLNARILWTFSAAARLLGDRSYLDVAALTKDYILSHFIDKQYGGAFWSLTPEGEPLDTKKQYYAIAFVIYGLAEYNRATGDKEALDAAISLFRDIEKHSRDRVKGGYLEAATREWEPIADMRLSEKDRNDAKTMNTHLHILEGYSALCRVWPTDEIREALQSMIEIFLDRIILPDGHLALFFDEDWRLQSHMASYGHDIEASWLLCEAAGVLRNSVAETDERDYAALEQRVREACARVADASLEGYRPGEGMIYEYDPDTGHLDSDRHWWVQAETVVGCINQYQCCGDKQWLRRACETLEFIRKEIVCPEGEWFWSARPLEGGGFAPNTDDDRAGFWKCPYHNGRMCLELLERGF